ncbi:histone deacetylase 9-B-like [Sinocyclocheilus grahami]|uniref:histone deacetylase 9-B-like n=1 Tax=Sinocyclocheilus grahami TaxID=75366 RepID=UPI0007ACA213|nr:PREDICTED: histone deacetylase 9-B-like [Sinocyclocheilus grahami]
MLQTIYEADSCFSTDSIGKHRLPLTPHYADMHNVNNSVDIKPEVPLALDPGSPLDLRTDVRMQSSASDPTVWERQLQQELLLIQKQQQIQKQLLISEFQKQHENLVRQHQAQLQEHLKLQQELLAMKQQQEQLEKERKLELQSQERELERHRREQHVLVLRNREKSRESAVASNEVKQKLQEFLLSKSTKDGTTNGVPQSSKLWYTASHHTSLEQSSPPLGGASSSCKISLLSPLDSRDDFPLRKTDFKNISLSLSLPPSLFPSQRWPSQPRLLGAESSVSLLNLYTSPSLPNISLGLSAASPISAALGLQEKHVEGGGVSAVIQGLPTQLLGPVPLSVAMETKVSSSHQALLQHLLQKEQLRHQKILSTGQSPVHPPSPLAMMESSPSSTRPKLPRHRPLNRTQSAPLPQSTLAQLVIQQQHQNFLEKQKQYQQQVHINKVQSLNQPVSATMTLVLSWEDEDEAE